MTRGTLRRGAAALGGAALAVAAAGVALAEAGRLTGAGSTAIYPVLAKWASAYKERAGVEVNYQAIGSGGGIAQIKARTVDFAETDMPLAPEDLAQAGLAQFPAVIIGIAPVVNLPGIAPGALCLDGKTLAKIYLGEIKRWDDAAIQALNPGLALPAKEITVVHRSDGSGTTFNFADYLSKVSPAWKDRVGAGTSVRWPAGVGGKGNAGVAAYVQQVAGAIGYVEHAYAAQNKMTWTKMVNAAGNPVVPGLASFQAAAEGVDFGATRDFYAILTNQSGPESWPITGATYTLVRKDAPADRKQALVRFFRWCLADGREMAKALDYVPLPARTVAAIEAYWKEELRP
jgi:phosphate transport system substrate-binding protein